MSVEAFGSCVIHTCSDCDPCSTHTCKDVEDVIDVKELNEKHIPFPRAVKLSRASHVILVLVATSDMNLICKDKNRESDGLFMDAQEPSFDLDIKLSTSSSFDPIWIGGTKWSHWSFY